jgi:glutamate synthase (NADPH/NADH) large chain
MTGGLAVILGPTGRNVAAGMSGGIAYVLDLDESLLNTEMVDALPLSDADADLLRGVVTRHHEETGSDVAGALVADWAGVPARFTKVLPRDYARVLAAQEEAEAEGLDSAATTIKMMDAARA